jgi:hypothetical protein
MCGHSDSSPEDLIAKAQTDSAQKIQNTRFVVTTFLKGLCNINKLLQ